MPELKEVSGQWFAFDPSLGMWVAISAVTATLIGLGLAWNYRKVVKPNTVHIVQSRKKTITYGRGYDAGNSYYEWPTWWPVIGVQKIVLPLSVFDLDLKNYEAYDEQKVPFMVDVKAFFRISDPQTAAERVSDMRELLEQLEGILQGTVRTVLAKHNIEAIMMERSTFGNMFTSETEAQLREWGVENVKNIELMDVRDGQGSQTVSNIMAKKESLIERDSRVEVAANKRDAEIAEIEALREADISREQAEQAVGERKAQKDKMVGVADEQAQQEIKEQARITAEKDMNVVKVKVVRQAEIKKEAAIVQAEEDKATDIVKAEGQKQQTIVIAEGDLQDQLREAEGIEAIGKANAEAARLLEMARVTPELELAREIGENEGYQEYLVKIRTVEKDEEVGKEQAKALQVADIKVISNSGDVAGGVDNVMDLFTSKGGTNLGAMAEAFAQTEKGAEVLSRLGVGKGNGNGSHV